MSSHQTKRKIIEGDESRARKKLKVSCSNQNDRVDMEMNVYQDMASTMTNPRHQGIFSSGTGREKLAIPTDEDEDLGVYPLLNADDNPTDREDELHVADEELEPDPAGYVCPLCFEDIEEKSGVIFFIRCSHFFHASCIDREYVNRCPTCNTRLDGPFGKMQQMPLSIAKLLFYFDVKTRCTLINNILREGEFIDSLSPRQFYYVLRKNVFDGKIPKLRNLFMKARLIHREPYQLLLDGRVDIFMSGKISMKEKISQIALDLYKRLDGTNLSTVTFLLDLFEDLYMYFDEQ